MSNALPDSGGAYYDGETGSPVGIVKRNVAAAFAKVRSGEVGGEAVGFAVGLAVGPALAFAAKSAGVLE